MGCWVVGSRRATKGSQHGPNMVPKWSQNGFKNDSPAHGDVFEEKKKRQIEQSVAGATLDEEKAKAAYNEHIEQVIATCTYCAMISVSPPLL